MLAKWAARDDQPILTTSTIPCIKRGLKILSKASIFFKTCIMYPGPLILTISTTIFLAGDGEKNSLLKQKSLFGNFVLEMGRFFLEMEEKLILLFYLKWTVFGCFIFFLFLPMVAAISGS
jgi:hypothetical protein